MGGKELSIWYPGNIVTLRPLWNRVTTLCATRTASLTFQRVNFTQVLEILYVRCF